VKNEDGHPNRKLIQETLLIGSRSPFVVKEVEPSVGEDTSQHVARGYWETFQLLREK